jgi:predicted SprT family Zn-dependent metalloprotease|tara:strand:- start:482 stop:943 length:462 start_codon:yes stop_codon:yes gene_type:complete
MFSISKKKARKAMLEEAKRQMYRNEVVFSEDNRPVNSIKALYAELNEEIFNGELPHIEVKMNGRLRKTLGKAFYLLEAGGRMRPTRIEIKKSHRWTPRFLRKVMIHEMCHIWAYEFHNEKGHGRKFWLKMKELGYPKTHNWTDAQSFEKDIYS